MAHAVSNATQAPKVEHTQAARNSQAPKQASKSSTAEDKVTISDAGRAAQKSGSKSGGKK